MFKAVFVVTLLCVSIAIERCEAESVEHPPEPFVPSRFRVINSQFHQEPNLEYNFEWVSYCHCASTRQNKMGDAMCVLLSHPSQKFESGELFAEEGKLRTINGQDVIVTRGSYTTLEQDGSMVRIDYIADENGFRVGECLTFWLCELFHGILSVFLYNFVTFSWINASFIGLIDSATCSAGILHRHIHLDNNFQKANKNMNKTNWWWQEVCRFQSTFLVKNVTVLLGETDWAWKLPPIRDPLNPSNCPEMIDSIQISVLCLIKMA